MSIRNAIGAAVGLLALGSTGANAQTLAQKATAAQFAKAVSKGSDPTVGGLFPVTAEQTATLVKLQGCKSQFAGAKVRDRVVFLWKCAANSEANYTVTDIYFDRNGPARIDISKAVAVTTSVEVPN